MAKRDPRRAPAYSIAQAAQYLKILAPTVRSWVLGRDYPRQPGKGRFKPAVVIQSGPNHHLSFLNLIEISALQALRTGHKFKPSAVSTALDYAGQDLAVTNLLASKHLYARPGELFLARYCQLGNLNRADELCIKAVLRGLQHRIQWDDGIPVRSFPPVPRTPGAKSVMLDPRVAFGRPALTRLSVSTSVIVDRINAGEETADLAKDYGATDEEIIDALAYERAT